MRISCAMNNSWCSLGASVRVSNLETGFKVWKFPAGTFGFVHLSPARDFLKRLSLPKNRPIRIFLQQILPVNFGTNIRMIASKSTNRFKRNSKLEVPIQAIGNILRYLAQWTSSNEVIKPLVQPERFVRWSDSGRISIWGRRYPSRKGRLKNNWKFNF